VDLGDPVDGRAPLVLLVRLGQRSDQPVGVASLEIMGARHEREQVGDAVPRAHAANRSLCTMAESAAKPPALPLVWPCAGRPPVGVRQGHRDRHRRGMRPCRCSRRRRRRPSPRQAAAVGAPVPAAAGVVNIDHGEAARREELHEGVEPRTRAGGRAAVAGDDQRRPLPAGPASRQRGRVEQAVDDTVVLAHEAERLGNSDVGVGEQRRHTAGVGGPRRRLRGPPERGPRRCGRPQPQCGAVLGGDRVDLDARLVDLGERPTVAPDHADAVAPLAPPHDQERAVRQLGHRGRAEAPVGPVELACSSLSRRAGSPRCQRQGCHHP